MEGRKHRSKKEESDNKEDSKRSRRDKERSGERHKERDRESRHSEEREREKERDKEKERERERERDRDKEREREREKGREKERDKEKDREKERDKNKEREKEKERERAKKKEKEHEREKRKREKERERVREKEKKLERERRRHSDRDDDYSSDTSEDGRRDRDKKRRRREEDGHSERSGTTKSSKHRETDGEDVIIKKSHDDSEKKEKLTTREEDLEEEQRQLDDEMEKRRRRVQEWQELKRKKEELEKAKQVEEPNSGKAWTLEGESDDDETAHPDNVGDDMIVDNNINDDGVDNMIIDAENRTDEPLMENGLGENGAAEEDDIDPLDAFMNSMVLPEVEKLKSTSAPPAVGDSGTEKKNQEKNAIKRNGEQPKKSTSRGIGRIIPGEDSDGDYADLEDDGNVSEDEDDEEFMKRVKKTKAEKLTIVDHSKIDYQPFRKNFYIEVKEITRMIPEEVFAYRKDLELKMHGKDVPKPIKLWHQTGLTSKILETIKKLNYEKPMPIQAQALPIIMSGRDCIGVAKTGSGKTLAFVLPMLRHIKDQPPVVAGDGPIGLIMAPTRELVQQIHSDIKKFAKVVGVRCVPVYGGSGVAQQISELKRGTEIVVCTPGRMIDILCTSGGKITNLRRVTYLVMDEADRMFDMGFEPQITRIVQNTRPDRQTVLFSATFPRQVEVLARKVLNKPVEVQVGGRSVVNKDITQLVEVRPESDRFLRLLELLGEWYEKGKILVFVHSQDKCDAVFKELLKHGYPCLSLHGAKDQTDRESTISDFKSNVCNLLIATSVAARGLDVKELELVVNFDVPNHYEDYVHRVGRTGRAGRKGCAITFISEEDARYAPDLVKALELSEQVVPADLKAIADGFMAKVNQGLEQAHGTGYGGSGFKFNEEEDEVRKAAKKAQAKEYGFEEDKSDSDDDDDGIRKAGGDLSQQAALAQIAAIAAATKANTAAMATSVVGNQLLTGNGLPIPVAGALGSLPMSLTPSVLPIATNDGSAAARAAALAAAMNLQHNLAKIQADALPEHYEAELEINDFPQNARWKVTHKETLGPISEWTGAAITTRGQFYPPGKVVGPGERKLYLFIEGPTEISVKRAKSELKRVLEDITNQTTSLPGGAQPGKYSVV
uniref:RNA helicase n=2 Tax=Kalanchoe fedtschenkoi TaxID=63787 RepID=A0A7N0TTU3_KALFE